MLNKLFNIGIALVLIVLSTLSNATEVPMLIKYMNHGTLDARHNYKFELMTLILERTKVKYGDYRIEAYVNELSAKRQAALLSEGELINVLFTTPGSVISEVDVIPVAVDVFRGILGNRICLINRNQPVNFNSVKDIQSLSGVRIGQSLGWPDVEIYIFNQVIPVQAPTFEGLFTMLSLKRFDCLALSADEIEYVYHEKRAQFPMLAVEPNLLIYYDLPIYFYISKQYPKIAARFADGLKTIQRNGEWDALFNRYYRNQLDKVNVNSRHRVCLKSPFMPLANQCMKK